MTEEEFIAAMRALATSAAGRNLSDDVAVLDVGGVRLVLTHDMIVEGIHYLPGDPPADVAWKLLAVNLSDLAAKGARPLGALLGYTLGSGDWDRAFANGLGEAMAAFGVTLLGGDTVSGAESNPRTLGLTAIGTAVGDIPSRSGASPGDHLWVSGSIGDAGAGLRALRDSSGGAGALIERYRKPRPRLEAGQALAPLASAMMDVSDGLLIDAARLAAASAAAVEIDLALVPLSEAYIAFACEERDARLAAATAGDDYELLFAASPEKSAVILAISDDLALPLSRIGEVRAGSGLRLVDGNEKLPLPDRLGWSHGS